MPASFAYLAHRCVLSVTGTDAPGFLERLVTCRTDNMVPGEARYGALLTPQGKIISDFLVCRTEDGFLLDLPRDFAGDLEKRLKLFRLRAAVDLERLPGMIVLAGLEPASGPRPVSGASHVFLDTRYPGARLRAFADETAWRQFHGHEAEWGAPIDAWQADRIASGVPECGMDFAAAQVFPTDVNMDRLGGIDFKKGCFVGQEVVSRMHRRGKARKRTLVVRGADLSPGHELRGETPIGTVTSVEGDLALATVRIDRMATAQVVTANDKQVSFEKPDWLQGEIDALLGDGD